MFELLTVITIIAILGTIAVTGFGKLRGGAEIKAAS